MIEYEGISNVERHLPPMKSSQLDFSQLELPKDEEAVYIGDLHDIPMFSKKRKSYVLYVIAQAPVVTAKQKLLAVKKTET